MVLIVIAVLLLTATIKDEVKAEDYCDKIQL